MIEAELYERGFIFFEGFVFTDRLRGFLLDNKNYTSETNFKDEPFIETELTDTDILRDIAKGFPSAFLEQFCRHEIYWQARRAFKGSYIEPHHDDYSDNPRGRTGAGQIIVWLVEAPFEGREFVWGEVVDFSKLPDSYPTATNTTVQDPKVFKELGSIKPQTGQGVIISRLNPIFWHSVSPLLTDTSVVSLKGVLKDRL